MVIFFIIFYGGVLVCLVLLPYLLYLAIKALRIYIAKNAIVQQRPAYTRFEENAAKSENKPL